MRLLCDFSYYDKMMTLFNGFTSALEDPECTTAFLTSCFYKKYMNEMEEVHLFQSNHFEQVWKYFNETVIPHKIAVYEEGYKITQKLIFKNSSVDKKTFLMNLMIHDLSKFSVKECFAYSTYDFKKGEDSEQFDLAWHHHKLNNPHHPEHWFNVGKDGSTAPFAIPEIYIFEMIADWLGASRIYGTPFTEWYKSNIHRFYFHKKTEKKLQIIIEDLGIA